MTAHPWRCRNRVLPLGPEAVIMGILNVTPDSFSDGGRFFSSESAIMHGIAMARAGARILDIGGESSRPGAEAVPVEEELRRVVPVVQRLVRETDCLLSVDTTKSMVAEHALAAGAHIVNDITALTGDPQMPSVVRRYGAGAVLMHMQGSPRTMQLEPHYRDVVAEVVDYLDGRVRALALAGIDPATLAVDPGIGFGKTVEHNLALLRGLPALVRLGHPVVVGVSRKSFLGRLTGREVADRLLPSLTAMTLAIQHGAQVIRVHDVKESCEVAHLLATFGPPTEPPSS